MDSFRGRSAATRFATWVRSCDWPCRVYGSAIAATRCAAISRGSRVSNCDAISCGSKSFAGSAEWVDGIWHSFPERVSERLQISLAAFRAVADIRTEFNAPAAMYGSAQTFGYANAKLSCCAAYISCYASHRPDRAMSTDGRTSVGTESNGR